MFIVNPERPLPRFSNYPLRLLFVLTSLFFRHFIIVIIISDCRCKSASKTREWTSTRFFSFAGIWMFWLISKNFFRFLFLLKDCCLLFYSCKKLFTDEIDNFFVMSFGDSPGWIGLYWNDAKYAGSRVVWYASDGCNVGHTCFVSRSSTLIPTVVLKIDSTIYLIYPYPLEKH